MAECTSIEHNFHETPNRSNDQQFSLNKINEIKHYFTAEIRERTNEQKILVSILLL